MCPSLLLPSRVRFSPFVIPSTGMLILDAITAGGLLPTSASSDNTGAGGASSSASTLSGMGLTISGAISVAAAVLLA